MVLVDSSVWIDGLRNVVSPAVRALDALIESEEAAVAPVILQEVLQGASTKERFVRLRKYLETFPVLVPRDPVGTYIRAGEFWLECRLRGLTPRSPHDCLVAVIATERRVALLHGDRDFTRMATIERRLRIHSASL